MDFLRKADPEIYQTIQLEAKRQKETINLIASENYPSQAVLEAQGSFLTAKYAEGYPQHRYYGGCENMDIIENLAIQRARELFHAEHANVQSHAGSQANMAAYFAVLNPGDLIMGMSLAHGGHLTHGAKASFSGRLYNAISYGVKRDTERIDYVEAEKLAVKNKPKLIVVGASSYPRIIDFERFRFMADKIGAKLLVDIAHTAGMVAAGLYPSPLPYADIVTGTTQKTLRGTRSGFILCRKELASAIDAAVFPRSQGGPLMHAIAAKAVTFYEAMQPSFVDYQQALLENAQTLALVLRQGGLRLITGGTDIHLALLDLTDIEINGLEAEQLLHDVGIVVNRNVIPFDTKAPTITGGMRVGTPAVTTRGMGSAEMEIIGRIIIQVLTNSKDETIKVRARQDVADICRRFPIPGIS